MSLVLEVSQATFFYNTSRTRGPILSQKGPGCSEKPRFKALKTEAVAAVRQAFAEKRDWRPRGVAKKKKLTTPLARERRFSIKRAQAATRSKIHIKV